MARAFCPRHHVCGALKVGGEMDFQVQEQTYFLTLADDDKRWEVFVATPTGAR